MVYILNELAVVNHGKMVNETEVEERRGMHIVVVSSIKVHDAFPLPLDTWIMHLSLVLKGLWEVSPLESLAAETVLKARAKLKL